MAAVKRIAAILLLLFGVGLYVTAASLAGSREVDSEPYRRVTLAFLRDWCGDLELHCDDWPERMVAERQTDLDACFDAGGDIRACLTERGIRP